jgi:hypothetical protein
MERKRLLSVAGALLISCAAWAIPFDNTTGPEAKCIVAASGGDFTTLADAVASFNSVVGGINRPWILEIQSNTTETTNPMMGNTFGAGGSVTIKPGAATQPVVTFTNTGATGQPGFFAHFGIGVKDTFLSNASNTFASNNKYVIDGSNTVGGTTRDLKFSVNLASTVNWVLGVIGDNDGVVIKNCIVYMKDTSGSHGPIRWASIGVDAANGILTDLTPDNGVVENCYLHSQDSAGVSGFIFQTSNAQGVLTPGTTIQNMQLLNNECYAKQRGFFLNGCGSFTIRGNRVDVGNATITSGYLMVPFFHLSSNSNVGWTGVIENNITSNTLTGGSSTSYGLTEYDLSPTSGTMIIRNNIHRAPTFTAVAATDGNYRVFSCGSGVTTYNIEHNSVDWPASVAVSGATLGACAIVNAPTTFTAGALSVKNNCFRFGQAAANAFAYRVRDTPNVTINNNNVGIVGSANVGNMNLTAYNTFGAWQGAGYDTPGQSVDPTGTTPAWDATLHFASKPITGLATVASSTILTDFDGNARPATGAVPGADEPVAITEVRDWMMF